MPECVPARLHRHVLPTDNELAPGAGGALTDTQPVTRSKQAPAPLAASQPLLASRLASPRLLHPGPARSTLTRLDYRSTFPLPRPPSLKALQRRQYKRGQAKRAGMLVD
eukprot:scaffold5674_cov129-Isochrysis_galbana.AAC.6